jgi:hypothetical protein
LTVGALTALVATRRRIVLRADLSGGPSGPTGPELYVLLDGALAIVTTDGTSYHLAGVVVDADSDPDAGAEAIASRTGRGVLLQAAA